MKCPEQLEHGRTKKLTRCLFYHAIHGVGLFNLHAADFFFKSFQWKAWRVRDLKSTISLNHLSSSCPVSRTYYLRTLSNQYFPTFKSISLIFKGIRFPTSHSFPGGKHSCPWQRIKMEKSYRIIINKYDSYLCNTYLQQTSTSNIVLYV